jgi:hypothetical protein
MAYKWPRSPIDSRPLQPEEMTDQQRSEAADLVASAMEDGGPSPGADFLMWLRKALGADSQRAILERCLGGRGVEEYLVAHWNRQIVSYPDLQEDSMRLTREQIEEAVAHYVFAAMRAAVDDLTAEQHAAHARDMIAKGYAVEIYRATDSLMLA